MKAVLFAALLLVGEGHQGIHLTVDEIPDRSVWIHPVIPIFGRTPIQEGEWIAIPDILLCPGAPVTITRVERAVKYWERLGYTFGSITQALPGNMNCANSGASYETITIDIPSQSFKFESHLGSTKAWRYTANDEIFKARIEIQPSWGRTERILEHEIGHALGWRDMNSIGHIMNGTWSTGGYNSTGIKK